MNSPKRSKSPSKKTKAPGNYVVTVVTQILAKTLVEATVEELQERLELAKKKQTEATLTDDYNEILMSKKEVETLEQEIDAVKNAFPPTRARWVVMCELML